LTICTQKSHFQFNGEFFDQIDGVAMGSPLGPLFANFFMSDFECKHMSKLKSLGLILWYRYVDDVFATTTSKEAADTCLEYLNDQHNNIKFTIEHEDNNKIPFLESWVERKPNKYITYVYHKKTFTGVYLNWLSLTARRYKIGLIHNLAYRIYMICSEVKDRDTELNKFRHLLIQNRYPPHVVDEHLVRVKLKFEKQNKTIEEEKTKKIKFITLPYINNKCESFARELKWKVESNFKDIELNVAFQSPKTIGQLFPFKDKIVDNKNKSMVIYKISCKQCDATYIGKTERILSYRLNEHSKSKTSAIYQHSTDTGHQMNFDNPEIIDNASNDLKLRIKELLHILKKKPSLNKQLNDQSQFEIKTFIIQAYPQFREDTTIGASAFSNTYTRPNNRFQIHNKNS
jgi:hypothetical protein